MFARLIKINLKPTRVAEFNEKFEQQIIPMLRKTKGFRDAITFVVPGGAEAVAISLWDLKEHADAYNSVMYPEVLKALAMVLEGTPQVKTYEVTASTFAKVAAPAAV